MVRNAVWCLSNLCRGKSPAVDFNKVSESISSAVLLSFSKSTWLLMVSIGCSSLTRTQSASPSSGCRCSRWYVLGNFVFIRRTEWEDPSRHSCCGHSTTRWTLSVRISHTAHLNGNANLSLSSYPVLNVQSSALRAVGNIVTGDDHQTQVDRSLVLCLSATRQTVRLGCTRCRCVVPSVNITAKSKRINQKGSMLDLI